MSKGLAAFVVLWMVVLSGPVAQGQIDKTLHNLSATGPGVVKAPGVSELCVFCHTPHRVGTTRALWNRDLSPTTYKLYSSSTLEATLKQPTGASRLCLSCHDGTTAMGNLRVPPAGGQPALGPLTGGASLGTDLSDDHPVSFVYDSALASKRGELADPTTLPKALPLDNTQQLQCTTCHDPHEDRYRKFLRLENQAGALCTACHKRRNWTGSAHASSPATWKGTGTNPWSDSPHTRVSDNACMNCHQPHAAPRPARLLKNAQERAVCLVCHDGSTAEKNIARETLKSSAHPVASTDWVHDPKEDPQTMPRHVTCVDCHNPHQVVATAASPPAVSGRLRGVRGLTISGATVGNASFEYEVCLKCHGIGDQTTMGRVVRQDNTRNMRLKINPSNPSYHPIAAIGKNTTMGGFEPGYSVASLIYCTNCHNNDEWTPTGTNPRGPHGSRHTPILEREYRTRDPLAESFSAYALCYKCHNRDSLINDRANEFPHKEHVQKEQTPCAACHDAHGSRNAVALINFMLKDSTGKTVVRPSKNQGRLEFISLGSGSGQCFLLCHGKNHEPETYP